MGTRLCRHPNLITPPGNFIKKETLTQVFSFEFRETFKYTYFEEHLQKAAPEAQIPLSSSLTLPYLYYPQ